MKELVKNILGKEQRVISYASPEDKLAKRVIINTIELSTGRKRLERAYEALGNLEIEDARIWNHVFPLLDIKLAYNEEVILKIITSRKRPIVIIANHPYGVADGMVLSWLLSKISNHFKLLVNEVLCREPLLGKYFYPIDFRPGKEALLTNIDSRKRALALIRQGGNLGIFPSGGVSTTPRLWDKVAEDLEWKNFLVKLVRSEEVDVLPVYFHGQNSRMFQVASHVHPNFRLGLLLNELDRLRGKTIHFTIGQLISAESLKNIPRKETLSFLKEQTFNLRYYEYS